MRELFILLLKKWACSHQWKTHRSTVIYADGDSPEDSLPVKSKELMICSKCGKFKKLSY